MGKIKKSIWILSQVVNPNPQSPTWIKIWGTPSKKKSSSVKIWSDKPVQRKRKDKT
jgi:hypothetical protein